MSQTAVALVVPELNGHFELQDVLLDQLQPDEALVEIHATGICQTDLGAADGHYGIRPNAVLGHEGAGVILETGAAVTGLSKGDKVLLSFSHCEACESCTSGHPSYCQTFFPRQMAGARPDGSAAMFAPGTRQPLYSSFFGQSSFGTHAVVHKSCAVRVPPETDLYRFAPLGCGVQAGAGAVLHTLDAQPGSTVAVFGAGAVGLSAVMAAKLRQAKTIIAVDVVPARLELAKKLGATHTILGGADQDAVEQQIRAICAPGSLQYALDSSGVPAVIDMMIRVLGTRGKATSVGSTGGDTKATINVVEFLSFGKEYLGCCEGDSNPSTFHPYLINLHANGQFPLDEFITYYDYKDYEQAMQDTRTGKAIKAVLRWK